MTTNIRRGLVLLVAMLALTVPAVLASSALADGRAGPGDFVEPTCFINDDGDEECPPV